MIRLNIVSLGKLKSGPLIELETEYRKRLGRFAQVKFVDVEPPKKLAKLEAEQRKSAETAVLLAAAPKGAYLIALDERGKEFSSEELAQFIERHAARESSALTFVIAGADGWDRAQVKRETRLQLSLSRMTLPHEMARLILVEQVYRALSILNHLPYHK